MEAIPGSGDCEARDLGSIQPVLFATSWAYVVVGLALVWWVARRPDVSRWWGWVFAAGLVTTGLGSVDYHGFAVAPQPLAHDFGLAVALLVALGIDLTKLTRNPRLGAGVAIGIGGLGAVALVIWPQVSPALAGVVGAVLIATEFLVYRRGLRTLSWTQPAALVALLLGFAAFAVSRTGGPLCAPDSWLQGHGVWHVMGAIALGLWALGALPETANDTDDQHLVEAAEPQSGSRATRNDPGR